MFDLRNWLLEKAFTTTGNSISRHAFNKEPWRMQELIEATSFFNRDTTIATRVYAFLNGQDHPFKCLQCGKTLKTNNKSIPRLYCNTKCSSLAIAVQKKIINTSILKYGVKNPSQSTQVKEKKEANNLAKYGVKHTLQIEQVREKGKQTSLEKYGVDNPMKSKEIREKRKKTCIRHYGVPYALQNPILIEKMQQTNRERYGVSHNMHRADIREKVSRTHMKRYGRPSPRGLHPHIQAIVSDKTLFLEKIKKEGTEEVARQLGVCPVTVNKYKRIHGMHKGESAEESRLAYFLRSIYDGEIITRDRRILKPKELDIYIPEYQLAIEYDGVYWHTEQYLPKNYHLDKTLRCARKNIQLLHIFSSDSWPIWQSVLSNRLTRGVSIGARETSVGKPSSSTSYEFLEQNHLQGGIHGGIKIGLYHKDQLLSLMVFCKSRFNKNYEYELLRFCTKRGHRVIGGASKLLKHSGVTSCISYANRRWSNGNLYEKLGFKYSHRTPPNFFYTKDYQTLYSRNNFQRHLLPKKLDNFDQHITANQNMLVAGYQRIWDCGNLVYVKKL